MKGIIDRVGTKREDIPWTEKTLDPELVQLVQNYRTADRPVLFSLMEKYPAKQKIIFQTRSEVDQWVSGF